MADLINQFDSKSLGRLSSEDAVLLFRRLLWSAVFRRSLPISSVTITANVNVPDGGIDAEIAKNSLTVQQDLLVAGKSFFQIKAGTSATPWQKAWVRNELFGTKKPSKAAMGDAVRHCLANRGRYVLVCFGCDFTGTQERNAKKHFKEYFKACGYKNPRVEVWGQATLAGLILQYPSLILRLANRDQLPFSTYTEWQLDAEMVKPFEAGASQQRLIQQTREALRGSQVRHIRLIGEPGLGKTRLVLEALAPEDLASPTIYVRHPEDFERSPLFNSLLRADDQSYAIIVIDDCPPRHRASIWNAIRQRSDRLRLITLDHGPEDSVDNLMQVLQCPPLESTQIEAILSDYIGKNGNVRRWAEFCSGSPRVAHAVGANLQLNPDDILKSPASVPIWDRFIHGNTRVGSQEESQRELVLRYLALFQKFGFEGPVQAEGKFIAKLVEEADPTITYSKFQSIIKHYRDRRIIQGKTTLFLVPKALHIYLWRQFWQHYGLGLDLPNLLSVLPESLFRWFAEMFKYGYESKECLVQIEKLTQAGGPFDNRTFLQGVGAVLLNDLAEAHPGAVLKCIERTVGTWSHSELVNFAKQRQYLVWALEKIAIWKQFFRRAAEMLLKLAVAENSKMGNNATGTFCGLFDMGFAQMASSEAPPSERLTVLETALKSSDEAVRAIAIKAIGHMLAEHPHSKMVGPEHQGVRPEPKLWTPKKWSEVFEAYRKAWKVAADFRKKTTALEKEAITKVMIDASYGRLQTRQMDAGIISFFKELSGEGLENRRLVTQVVARFRTFKWHHLRKQTVKALRDLDRQITGTTTKSRIERFVLFGSWDDYRDGPYSAKHMAMLRSLAKSILGEPSALKGLLPMLSSENGIASVGFGRVLADEDVKFSWWPEVYATYLAAGESAQGGFITGYLSGIFFKDRDLWESTVLGMLDNNSVRQNAQSLITGSGLTENVLNALCQGIDKGEIKADAISSLGYSGHYNFPPDRYVKFIEWCVQNGTAAVLKAGLETAHRLYCMSAQPLPIPELPILRLLTAPRLFTQEPESDSHHSWSELLKAFVAKYPYHAITLFDAVIRQFRNWETVLRFEYSLAQNALIELIHQNPHDCWQVLEKHLAPLDSRKATNILHWLGPHGAFGETGRAGPLSLFNIEDVFQWIDVDPLKRAELIIQECPSDLSTGSMTRELAAKYGEQDDVQRALWHCFGSDGWSGKASEHHRKVQDKFRNWLSKETSSPVIKFLEAYIEYLGKLIARDEIEEERHF